MEQGTASVQQVRYTPMRYNDQGEFAVGYLTIRASIQTIRANGCTLGIVQTWVQEPGWKLDVKNIIIYPYCSGSSKIIHFLSCQNTILFS